VFDGQVEGLVEFSHWVRDVVVYIFQELLNRLLAYLGLLSLKVTTYDQRLELKLHD
jgi:hypothetical protein